MQNSKYNSSELEFIENLAIQKQYDPTDLFEDIKKGNYLDLNIDDGLTPVHLAATFGMNNILQLAIDKGFRDITDDVGNTPLHCAAMGHAHNSIKLLVGSGANVDALDKEEHKAILLILAPSNTQQDLDSMKILLDASKIPSNAVAQAIMGTHKSHAEPSKLTAEREFLLNYQQMLNAKKAFAKELVDSRHSSSSLYNVDFLSGPSLVAASANISHSSVHPKQSHKDGINNSKAEKGLG